MSALEVRKFPWNFSGVDFVWNPDHPSFAITMNKFSFWAIGFEKYICNVMRDAEKRIKDPAVLAEAQVFRTQESVHSLAHRKHVRALIERYPGLQESLDKVIKHYDDLYGSRDLKYHLAYIGALESTFTPSMKLLIDNREDLMAKGDARVASLLLWHFCEEIEHRASGIAIYDELFGNYFFKVKNFKGFLKHVMSVFELMDAEFRIHVNDVSQELYTPDRNRPLPRLQRAKMIYGVLMSQMPWHKAEHQTEAKYFQEWLTHYKRGDDMTQIYGVPKKQTAQAVAN